MRSNYGNKMELTKLLEDYREELRLNFKIYTKQAFDILPKIYKPRILDIGCGSGVPSIHLAKLSDGYITGIDIDEPALERFRFIKT